MPATVASSNSSHLRPLTIGCHTLPGNLLLAPMAGVTDLPFRQLCRRFGAALATAEMVSSQTALWGQRKSVRRLDYRSESGPTCAQILGADPRQMAEAARACVALGADIIDINMGCPARKVCRVAAGAALLEDEPQVARILDAVVAAVNVPLGVPVTLKIRSGPEPARRNAVRIARLARDCGIAALTVHGRSRRCHYGVPAEFDTLRAIRADNDITLIANGDISSATDVRRALDASGADAIMIGRAARGRPWLFQSIASALGVHDEQQEQRIATSVIAAILAEHLEALYDFYGSHAGTRIARKHIAWYCHGLSGAAAFRQTINHAQTPAEQLRQVNAFFTHCLDTEILAA